MNYKFLFQLLYHMFYQTLKCHLNLLHHVFYRSFTFSHCRVLTLWTWRCTMETIMSWLASSSDFLLDLLPPWQISEWTTVYWSWIILSVTCIWTICKDNRCNTWILVSYWGLNILRWCSLGVMIYILSLIHTFGVLVAQLLYSAQVEAKRSCRYMQCILLYNH